MTSSARRVAGRKRALPALLLAALLPAVGAVTAAQPAQGEPTLDEIRRAMVLAQLQERCGAAFGELRPDSRLSGDDRGTLLRCLWVRDAGQREQRGAAADATLGAWMARTGVTPETPADRLAAAWRHAVP